MPLKDLVNKFAHVRFEPSGFTGNAEIPIAKSLVDYIFRWLGSRFLDTDDKAGLGLIDRSAVADGIDAPAPSANPFAAGIAALTSSPVPHPVVANTSTAPTRTRLNRGGTHRDLRWRHLLPPRAQSPDRMPPSNCRSGHAAPANGGELTVIATNGHATNGAARRATETVGGPRPSP